ncbi:MAG: IS3 family transposase [Spirochaetaceae bacterium]|nr:IS3 family transposase [Spirochaetaceae bacterium]
MDEFIDWVNNYIICYNEKRIKDSLGGLSSVEYRKELALNI